MSLCKEYNNSSNSGILVDLIIFKLKQNNLSSLTKKSLFFL